MHGIRGYDPLDVRGEPYKKKKTFDMLQKLVASACSEKSFDEALRYVISCWFFVESTVRVLTELAHRLVLRWG